MSDIFKDMQMKTGCEYISDLPSHKRIVWKELKNKIFPSMTKNS